MGFWMTLRKLGTSPKDQIASKDQDREEQLNLLNQIKRLNDYLAFMTNDADPPSEESLTDETT